MRSHNRRWELCRSDDQFATPVTEREPTGHCEIFNWFRCWEPVAAFPIDRRECDRRTEFPGHPLGSLAVSRRRSKGNRHAVIGGSRSFRVLGAGFVLECGCVAICPTLQLEHRSCEQFEHPFPLKGNSLKTSLMLNAYLIYREEKFATLYARQNSKTKFVKLCSRLCIVIDYEFDCETDFNN